MILQSVQKLMIRECDQNGSLIIAEKCNNVTHLEIYRYCERKLECDCQCISRINFERYLRKIPDIMPNLQHLSISSCHRMLDVRIRSLKSFKMINHGCRNSCADFISINTSTDNVGYNQTDDEWDQ